MRWFLFQGNCIIPFVASSSDLRDVFTFLCVRTCSLYQLALVVSLHFALWFLSSKINRTIFSLKITSCKFLNVIIVFLTHWRALIYERNICSCTVLLFSFFLFFFFLKDPVLTRRHCVRVLVLVFTRAWQPSFLTSSA